MSEQSRRHSTSPKALVYEIRVRGHLGDQWHSWFDGMTIEREANGTSRLSGPLTDQAALHGLLRKVRDIGLPLISVNVIQQYLDEAAQFTNSPL